MLGCRRSGESIREPCERMFVRSTANFWRVKELVALGLSDYEVSRRSGVPRATVQRYRHRTGPPRASRTPWEPASHYDDWRPSRPGPYCYLLGLYLGDGCLYLPPRGNPRLGITLDASYPGIVDAAQRAIEATLPGAQVCRTQRAGCVVVSASHPAWPTAFPQHGPGPKHSREIRLAPWQAELTADRPRDFLRGLIHSDGSRATNAFSTRLLNGRVAQYSYTRYFFTNRSEDIRAIFCDHCELVGVRWTQSNAWNISVSHRDSVAILDSFIGPKR